MLKTNQRLSAVVLACIAILLVGCASLRLTSTINVEFQESVQGLREGDRVYLLGLPIGEVDNTLVVNNHAVVPVVLQDTRTFDPNSQVLFLVAPDNTRPGHYCLVAFVHPLPAEAGQPRFRGFTSKVKLDLQMGRERIESWWRSIAP